MATSYRDVRARTRVLEDRSYVEVSRKRLVAKDGSTEFVVVTRGALDPEGGKRAARFVTLPDDAAIMEWVIAALRAI